MKIEFVGWAKALFAPCPPCQRKSKWWARSRFAHPTQSESIEIHLSTNAPPYQPSSPGLTGRPSIPPAPAMESKGRGVLDTPLEPVIGLAEGETRWRGMTAYCEAQCTTPKTLCCSRPPVVNPVLPRQHVLCA